MSIIKKFNIYLCYTYEISTYVCRHLNKNKWNQKLST